MVNLRISRIVIVIIIIFVLVASLFTYVLTIQEMFSFVDEANKIIDHANNEATEQTIARTYIKDDDVVLELGARYGTVSCAINEKLRIKTNQVSVEPDDTVISALEINRATCNAGFHIYHGFISRRKMGLILDGYSTRQVVDDKSNSTSEASSTLEELQAQYSLKFNVLVADCEGCLCKFLEENPDFLNQLRLVTFEKDMPHMCDYVGISKMLLDRGFNLIGEDGFHVVYERNTSLRILVLQWYDNNIHSYASLNSQMNEKYCQKNGLSYKKDHIRRMPDRHQSWEKLYLTELCLTTLDYDYYIWVDADAFFFIESPNIVNLIEQHPDFDFIFSADINSETNINCGVFIVKNNQYSLQFIRLWTSPEYFTDTNLWEQTSLQKMWFDNIFEIQSHGIILPFGVMQRFSDTDNKLPKPYILHSAGRSFTDRVEISKKYFDVGNVVELFTSIPLFPIVSTIICVIILVMFIISSITRHEKSIVLLLIIFGLLALLILTKPKYENMVIPASYKIAIVTLTKGYANQDEYDPLIKRNQSIEKLIYNVYTPQPYIIIFHENNVSDDDIRYIKSKTTMPILFINVDSEFQYVNYVAENPICYTTPESEKFSMGYKNMCKFWFSGFLKYTTDYKYVVRVDEDCVIHFFPHDTIELMNINQYRLLSASMNESESDILAQVRFGTAQKPRLGRSI